MPKKLMQITYCFVMRNRFMQPKKVGYSKALVRISDTQAKCNCHGRAASCCSWVPPRPDAGTAASLSTGGIPRRPAKACIGQLPPPNDYCKQPSGRPLYLGSRRGADSLNLARMAGRN